jgi:hypothetical protein
VRNQLKSFVKLDKIKKEKNKGICHNSIIHPYSNTYLNEKTNSFLQYAYANIFLCLLSTGGRKNYSREKEILSEWSNPDYGSA